MPDQCQAIVEDWERPSYRAGPQRITAPGHKRCSKHAREHVKHLHLCGVHARMAREGLVMETGQVGHKDDIRAARRYPDKFPRGLYDWATTPRRRPRGS